jgi:hypothetical protein
MESDSVRGEEDAILENLCGTRFLEKDLGWVWLSMIIPMTMLLKLCKTMA